jgi:hypothetical protein
MNLIFRTFFFEEAVVYRPQIICMFIPPEKVKDPL